MNKPQGDLPKEKLRGALSAFVSALPSGMTDAPTRSDVWTPPRIAGLRKRLRMGQEDFARAIGYDYATSVSALENGRRKPSGAAIRVLDYVERYGVLEPSTP